MLLYDERGLRLYDDITTEVPEYYYLFRAEEEILKTNADDIVQTMLHGANVTTDEIVVEVTWCGVSVTTVDLAITAF